MTPRDWFIIAFVMALFMSASAAWLADMQSRKQEAQASIEAVRAAQAESRYDRDRREALEKLRRIYGR